MLIVITGFFGGCEIDFISSSAPIKISGYVTYESQPVIDVKIVSDFFHYTSTNQNGYYEFVTRSKKLVFYAKKAGFNFTPKTYDVSNNADSYDFEAEKAVPLNGILTLTEILISPTSIVSIPRNNFNYQVADKSHIKIAEFTLAVNSNTSQSLLFTLTENALLEKGRFTNLLGMKEIEQQTILAQNGEVNAKFSFMLKAYYKDSNTEEISTEKISFFESNSALDTGDLDENNNIKFSAASINSFSNSFTYNIQIVFKYQPED